MCDVINKSYHKKRRFQTGKYLVIKMLLKIFDIVLIFFWMCQQNKQRMNDVRKKGNCKKRLWFQHSLLEEIDDVIQVAWLLICTGTSTVKKGTYVRWPYESSNLRTRLYSTVPGWMNILNVHIFDCACIHWIPTIKQVVVKFMHIKIIAFTGNVIF